MLILQTTFCLYNITLIIIFVYILVFSINGTENTSLFSSTSAHLEVSRIKKLKRHLQRQVAANSHHKIY